MDHTATQHTTFYDVVVLFEKYLFNHDLKYNMHIQGDDDYKYHISFGAYGLNVFLKHPASDASLLISPYLKDKDGQSLLFPIIERCESPDKLSKHIRSIVGDCIKKLDMYNTILNEFSEKCMAKCKLDDHDMDEGYQTVSLHDGSTHLIYYFILNLLNRFGQEYKLEFVFDFHGLSYELKYRINDMEFNTIISNTAEQTAREAINYQFEKLYQQVYVPPFVYERILVDPLFYGENIFAIPK